MNKFSLLCSVIALICFVVAATLLSVQMLMGKVSYGTTFLDSCAFGFCLLMVVYNARCILKG